MPEIKFQHKIQYVEVEASEVILPDAEDVKRFELQIEEAKKAVETASEELSALGENPEESEKTKKQQALEQAGLIRDVCVKESANIKGFVEKYSPYAKEYVFDMHRWGHTEKALIVEELTKFNGDGSTSMNEELFKVAILAKCIDSWNREEKPTRDTIGALPEMIVENAYARLALESRPSPARLLFSGIACEGRAKRKSSKQ